jgi:hypothetical protein
MRYNLGTLLITVVVAGATVGFTGRWFVQLVKTVSFAHRHVVQLTFDELPQDDVAMLDWMRHEPGVFNALVHRNANGVFVEGWESRTVLESPPADPDVAGAFARLGYKKKVRNSN